MPTGLSRRNFVLSGAAGASILAVPWTHGIAAATAKVDPFTLGVASGAPAPDGFVIWTRLAPNPLAVDGQGGLREPVSVAWEIATDEGMRQVIRRGVVTADASWAHAVHVEVGGLSPDRPYWYFFTAMGHQSPTGRARTLPARGASVKRLKLAVASCSDWELGHFSAYRHMAAEEADMVLFLGDYIYEFSYQGERGKDRVRRHDTEADALSLADYRRRYALYRTDPDLQAVHASAPCLATWDDHEVQNDYANRWSQDVGTTEADFLARRAAGYRAFYEHMPLRRSMRPRGPDMKIYGATQVGDLADILVLDGRQYRTIQPCPRPNSRRGYVAPETCADLSAPDRTMLGWEQERWLYDRFRKGRSRWTIVAQDLLVARMEQLGRDGVFGHFTDGWDAYQANRTRMLTALDQSSARNPVFLGGDIHSFWATDLKRDFLDPASRTVATELVGGAISQYGPPEQAFANIQVKNPHVRFVDLKANGYFTLDLHTDHAEARFVAISDRRDRDAAARLLKSFVVEEGRPGVLAS